MNATNLTVNDTLKGKHDDKIAGPVRLASTSSPPHLEASQILAVKPNILDIEISTLALLTLLTTGWQMPPMHSSTTHKDYPCSLCPLC